MAEYPFFKIGSKALNEMLGVKDKRSVMSILNDLGVEIIYKGKNKFIITEDVIKALKDNNEIGYTGKSDLSKMFYSDNKFV